MSGKVPRHSIYDHNFPATGEGVLSDSGAFVAGGEGAGLPVGAVLPFPVDSPLPDGFLLCDGSSVLRSVYSELFALIGTTYGSVDGTHFNLPTKEDLYIIS